MLSIRQTTDHNKIREIITNPVLFRLTYGQETLLDSFIVPDDFKYLLVENDKELIGCFQIKNFTRTVLEAHIFLLPKYWGSSMSKDMVNIGHTWAKKNHYLKIFTKIPENATHTLKFVQALNYKCCGMIEKGIVYNKRLVTLFLYEFEV